MLPVQEEQRLQQTVAQTMVQRLMLVTAQSTKKPVLDSCLLCGVIPRLIKVSALSITRG